MKAKVIRQIDPMAISTAVYALANGGIVIAPTETCYAMLADATNRKAVDYAYRLKGRKKTKAMSIFVYDRHMLGRYAALNRYAKKLVKKYLPGPLTLILKKRKTDLAKNISKGGTVAIRMSPHPFIKRLLFNFMKPVTATSANISGKAEIYSSREIVSIFGGKADLIIDGGTFKKIPPTTIVDCMKKKPVVLRQGRIRIKK
ncbi:MAG: L-threonylcarbamoyladenylate synthase [Candidatus Micrarchaeota archaeon]